MAVACSSPPAADAVSLPHQESFAPTFAVRSLRCEPLKTPKSLISPSLVPNAALPLPLPRHVANVEMEDEKAND
jgi:hypothetical protein